ncbi:MAG: iron-sulfur cluster assembly accessory protein [Ekhidna sp.]|nr:iron-sulfur cluster assembly accessory protein [Ekhidna sp.]MBC6409276.1 iron-sulfur cluster assembly accessory protein [Ekhidna sp.]MBC6427037.1 iron-sulfur cluster assembly accessory protein [Ekhidna sp.]
MINVTDKAKEEIVMLLSKEGKSNDHNIRVSVKGGGCSGLMYDLSFDSQIREKDEVFEDKGIKILVDKKSLLYLLGTTLDFSGGLNGKGFQFVNPNASRTCGCGESFSV